MRKQQELAIEVRGVGRVYGDGAGQVTALSNIFLNIRQNEFFTLLGPSGCGKTTLLRLIAGFDFPTDGEILLYGEDIAPLPPFKRPVNTVFQNYALFPHMTVAQNIGFGLEMLGKPKHEIAARVEEMLALVHMEAMRNRKVMQISGGQQQRVALARALAPKPKVLLLDEPLSALDYKLRKEMQVELKRVQAETGITFIFVTHDQEEALAMSDRIAVMSHGEVRQVGAPWEIYDRPAERFVADFIGETNFLAADVISIDGPRTRVRLFNGSLLDATYPVDLMPEGKVTIVIRPEHAQLDTPSSTAMLNGQIEDLTYLGTDTHIRVRLPDTSLFTIRQQNNRVGPIGFSAGDPVSLNISEGAAQILKD
ncbi:ABC transporter ATP-binding protein [Aliirhizobium cellulosilyticum]|uniref:Spermidine/putrescine import ATP-binding protein PotA n=1 Tax=Aliirhizobium cellulosilyticum TaxID=393664 RepID=A0A7W6TD25_9HYPH|nr:ABC transporter ATP-binding protein [Rhizobium cellulosilyticum]MBB4346366.1 spermidine/putrescine transport system ATP-binding protein [Rhizobium cellulosilyticum]MBB4411240.1 spermidine/putrescine transport system ATP-binding protein [Rhizobium cellulosilyticum]MBB4445929.1 spermidine/putrescine transport system ATP-binding protein [Rhizobium cellulosilyticum]